MGSTPPWLIFPPPSVLPYLAGVAQKSGSPGLLVEADPSAILKRLPLFLPLLHKCLEDRRLGAVGVNRYDGDVVNGFEGDEPKEGVEEGQSEEEEEEERDDKLRRSMESKRASKGVRRHDIEKVDEAGMQRDIISSLVLCQLLTRCAWNVT